MIVLWTLKAWHLGALVAGTLLLSVSWAVLQFRAWPDRGGALVPLWWVASLGGLLAAGPLALAVGGWPEVVASWAWLAVGLAAPVVAVLVDRRRQDWLHRGNVVGAIERGLGGQEAVTVEDHDPDRTDPNLRRTLELAVQVQQDRQVLRALREAPCLVGLVDRRTRRVVVDGGVARRLEGRTAFLAQISPPPMAQPFHHAVDGRQLSGLVVPWRVASGSEVETRGAIVVALDVTEAS